MSSSPCILRSAHCAALIALAAVAGLVRVETSAPRPAESACKLVSVSPLERYMGQAATTSDSVWSRFHVDAPTATPWLRQFAVVAAWFLQADRPVNAATSSVSAPTAPDAPALAVALAPTAHLPLPATSFAADLPAGFPAEPVPALCTHAFLIPLPAGPPAGELSATPTAAGTMVPGDSAASGMFVRSRFWSIAPADEVSSMARLARKSDLGAVTAGSRLKNSPLSVARAALRGTAAWAARTSAAPASSPPASASLA